jgi:hypothetical protein
LQENYREKCREDEKERVFIKSGDMTMARMQQEKVQKFKGGNFLSFLRQRKKCGDIN